MIAVRAKLTTEQYEAFCMLPGRTEQERMLWALGRAFDSLRESDINPSAARLQAAQTMVDVETDEAHG